MNRKDQIHSRATERDDEWPGTKEAFIEGANWADQNPTHHIARLQRAVCEAKELIICEDPYLQGGVACKNCGICHPCKWLSRHGGGE